VPPATDAEGDIDFGHIDSFEWGRGKLALEGDWGDMTILADEVQVEFTIYDS
jgi:hypothetical protein